MKVIGINFSVMSFCIPFPINSKVIVKVYDGYLLYPAFSYTTFFIIKEIKQGSGVTLYKIITLYVWDVIKKNSTLQLALTPVIHFNSSIVSITYKFYQHRIISSNFIHAHF